jgi:hypothetical protein
MWLPFLHRRRRSFADNLAREMAAANAARLDEVVERQRQDTARQDERWEATRHALLKDAGGDIPGLAAVADGTAGPVVVTEIDGQEVIIGADEGVTGDAGELAEAIRESLRRLLPGQREAS